MKEDVLEQVVDDHLRGLGFLTQANVRYRPSQSHADYLAQADSGWSDIDVLAYSPTRYGADRVWVVSCKSWQVGLNPATRLEQLRQGKHANVHREVWMPKWGQALCDVVERLTGQRTFRFFTAVTKLTGDVSRWHDWRDEPQIRTSLEGNWVGFLRLEDLWRHSLLKSTTTLANSQIGRLAQMLLAAGQASPTDGDDSEDPSLTHPHQQTDEDFASVAGMWLPPPPVSSCEDINRYAHTVQGYEYAARHYGIEAGPEGLVGLIERQSGNSRPSFEILRLRQFALARSWHFVGAVPEEGESEHAEAMRLHSEIQQAWAARRFDRPDVPE